MMSRHGGMGWNFYCHFYSLCGEGWMKIVSSKFHPSWKLFFSLLTTTIIPPWIAFTFQSTWICDLQASDEKGGGDGNEELEMERIKLICRKFHATITQFSSKNKYKRERENGKFWESESLTKRVYFALKYNFKHFFHLAKLLHKLQIYL